MKVEEDEVEVGGGGEMNEDKGEMEEVRRRWRKKSMNSDQLIQSVIPYMMHVFCFFRRFIGSSFVGQIALNRHVQRNIKGSKNVG